LEEIKMDVNKCSKCDNLVVWGFGQYHRQNEMTWSGGYRCQNCGNAVEFDSDGFPPENIRRQLLEIGGKWRINFSNDKSILQKILLELKKVFKLNLSQIVQLKIKGFSDSIGGTRAEMEWLKSLMAKKGVTISIHEDNEKDSFDISRFLEISDLQ
jgi:DNA-directed RNA polymerase subunit RPC12/RpoP